MRKLTMSLYLKQLKIKYMQGNRKTQSEILSELCRTA